MFIIIMHNTCSLCHFCVNRSLSALYHTETRTFYTAYIYYNNCITLHALCGASGWAAHALLYAIFGARTAVSYRGTRRDTLERVLSPGRAAAAVQRLNACAYIMYTIRSRVPCNHFAYGRRIAPPSS